MRFDLRFVLCLILFLCFALAADAGPFRRASCSGGSCAIAPAAYSAPEPSTPFSPRDLVMAPTAKAERVVLPAEYGGTRPMQPQACAGGQCDVSPANRFGRVTVRAMRR